MAKNVFIPDSPAASEPNVFVPDNKPVEVASTQNTFVPDKTPSTSVNVFIPDKGSAPITKNVFVPDTETPEQTPTVKQPLDRATKLTHQISGRRDGLEAARLSFQDRSAKSLASLNKSSDANRLFNENPNLSNHQALTGLASGVDARGHFIKPGDEFDQRFNQLFIQNKLDAFSKVTGNNPMLSDEEIASQTSDQIFKGSFHREKGIIASKNARDMLESQGVDFSGPNEDITRALATETTAQRRLLGLPDEAVIGDDPSGLKVQNPEWYNLYSGKIENLQKAVVREAALGVVDANTVAPWSDVDRAVEVRRAVGEYFKSNPDLANSLLWNELPGAFGGTLPVLAAGPTGAPFMGFAMGAGAGRREAHEAGVSGFTAFVNTVGQGLIGASEALLFKGIAGAGEAGAAKSLKSIAKGLVEGFATESLQEGGQHLAGGSLAKVLFDYERDVMLGLGQTMGTGGIVGTGLSGANASIRMAAASKTAKIAGDFGRFIQSKIDQNLPITSKDLNGFVDSFIEPVEQVENTLIEPTEQIAGVSEETRQAADDLAASQYTAEQTSRPVASTAAPKSLATDPQAQTVTEPAQTQQAATQEARTGVDYLDKDTPDNIRKAIEKGDPDHLRNAVQSWGSDPADVRSAMRDLIDGVPTKPSDNITVYERRAQARAFLAYIKSARPVNFDLYRGSNNTLHGTLGAGSTKMTKFDLSSLPVGSVFSHGLDVPVGFTNNSSIASEFSKKGSAGIGKPVIIKINKGATAKKLHDSPISKTSDAENEHLFFGDLRIVAKKVKNGITEITVEAVSKQVRIDTQASVGRSSPKGATTSQATSAKSKPQPRPVKRSPAVVQPKGTAEAKKQAKVKDAPAKPKAKKQAKASQPRTDPKITIGADNKVTVEQGANFDRHMHAAVREAVGDDGTWTKPDSVTNAQQAQAAVDQGLHEGEGLARSIEKVNRGDGLNVNEIQGLGLKLKALLKRKAELLKIKNPSAAQKADIEINKNSISVVNNATETARSGGASVLQTGRMDFDVSSQSIIDRINKNREEGKKLTKKQESWIEKKFDQLEKMNSDLQAEVEKLKQAQADDVVSNDRKTNKKTRNTKQELDGEIQNLRRLFAAKC